MNSQMSRIKFVIINHLWNSDENLSLTEFHSFVYNEVYVSQCSNPADNVKYYYVLSQKITVSS